LSHSLNFANERHFSSLPMISTCPAHPIYIDLITLAIFVQQYTRWSCTLCSCLHSPVTSSLLSPKSLPQQLILKHLNLYFSLSVKNKF
jgi:hypothetical protein